MTEINYKNFVIALNNPHYRPPQPPPWAKEKSKESSNKTKQEVMTASCKRYVVTLKCDERKTLEVVGESKQFVTETICHYLSQYIDEGEALELKIKVKELENK